MKIQLHNNTIRFWTKPKLHRCQHGREKMRDARFSSSRTSIDTHMQTKINAFLRQIALCGAFAIRFPLTFLFARCRKHCWSTSRAFSHSFCPQNIFMALKIVTIFREFAKMRDFPHDCGMVDTYEIVMGASRNETKQHLMNQMDIQYQGKNMGWPRKEGYGPKEKGKPERKREKPSYYTDPCPPLAGDTLSSAREGRVRYIIDNAEIDDIAYHRSVIWPVGERPKQGMSRQTRYHALSEFTHYRSAISLVVFGDRRGFGDHPSHCLSGSETERKREKPRDLLEHDGEDRSTAI